MSTQFAILNKDVEILNGDNPINGLIEDEDYTIIAHRSNGITFLYPYHCIISLLNDDVKVYPVDNTPQGIYTLGDIRKLIKNN